MTSQTVRSPWFKYCKVRPQARLRLFCFPHAGGSASQFRLWGETLPDFIEVFPVQLPGREERLREQPFTQLAALLPALKDAILPYLDKQPVFFGHSMGALICFELTRYLRESKLALPQQLLLSAHRAPQLPRRHRFVHRLPDAEFIEEINTLAGTPEELLRNAEAMEMFLPLLRADFQLCETYQYAAEEPLGLPLSAFGGMMDESVNRQELDAWRLQTTGTFKLHMFPGSHFYLQNTDQAFLRLLSSKLAQTYYKDL